MAEPLSVKGYLAAVLNHAEDAIFSTDLRGEIVSWNPAAERLFGYSHIEATGRRAEMIIPAASRHEFHGLLQAACAGDRQVRREMPCCRSDGSLVEVEMTLAVVRDHRRDIGIAIIARDVSDRKRLEKALHNSEKLATTGRVAGSIAHEINNPLESVTNLLYMLQRDCPLDGRTKEYVGLVAEEVARVRQIARQTLGFYRESRVPVELHISELLDGALELYAQRIRVRHIGVHRRVGKQPPICGFPGEMRQVFSNLIVNALDAIGGDGELRLHVCEARDWRNPERQGVRVVFADNGPGIPGEHRQHIFEPFYTTKGDRGTGLGLWLSSGIIHKHGGNIRVRSSVRPGHSGTVFSIFLPASTSAQQPRAA